MNNEQAMAIREEAANLVVQNTKPEPLVVDSHYVQQTQVSLALLQDLVKKVLVRDRDYGPPYEGARTDTLYDPGASLIIAAFNCYAGHRRVLHFSNSSGKVAIVIEVPIIQRGTGAEVGSGIASCTVSETKYKYRWVREDQLGDWGYTKEDAAAFKTRVRWEHTEYQVPNPEVEELLNTIVTMASKRAEVDGAKGLPGVGSALRELFDKKKGSQKGQEDQRNRSDDQKGGDLNEDSPRWTTFWAATKALSLEPDKVHQRLGVKSMKDWMKTGKSLDDAIKELSNQLATEAEKAGTTKVSPAPKELASDWDKVTKEQVPDYGSLEVIFCRLTGRSVKELYGEFATTTRLGMTLGPWEAFLALKKKLAAKGNTEG